MQGFDVGNPEGTYHFRAKTRDGERLRGTFEVSHELLPAPAITSRTRGATGVPTTGVVASWTAVPGAAAYLVEVEDEDEELEVVLEADLGSDVTTFAIPEKWLRPDTEYAMGSAHFQQRIPLRFGDSVSYRGSSASRDLTRPAA